MNHEDIEDLKSKVAGLEAELLRLRTAPRVDTSLTRARRAQRGTLWAGAIGLCMLPLLGWSAIQLTEFQAGAPIVAADVNANFNALAASAAIIETTEIGQLETMHTCASATPCISPNLSVDLATDGTRAVRIELVGELDSNIILASAAGQEDVQGEITIQRSTDGGDWEDVHRTTLRYFDTAGAQINLQVPVSGISYIDRPTTAGVHSYQVVTRVPMPMNATLTLTQVRLAATDAGTLE